MEWWALIWNALTVIGRLLIELKGPEQTLAFQTELYNSLRLSHKEELIGQRRVAGGVHEAGGLLDEVHRLPLVRDGYVVDALKEFDGGHLCHLEQPVHTVQDDLKINTDTHVNIEAALGFTGVAVHTYVRP